MKIAFDSDKAPPNKNNQTLISPKAAGAAPQGDVAAGKAKNPPPIVVPAISAACDAIVVSLLLPLSSRVFNTETDVRQCCRRDTGVTNAAALWLSH
jgi:hypothetical protein